MTIWQVLPDRNVTRLIMYSFAIIFVYFLFLYKAQIRLIYTSTHISGWHHFVHSICTWIKNLAIMKIMTIIKTSLWKGLMKKICYFVDVLPLMFEFNQVRLIHKKCLLKYCFVKIHYLEKKHFLPTNFFIFHFRRICKSSYKFLNEWLEFPLKHSFHIPNTVKVIDVK